MLTWGSAVVRESSQNSQRELRNFCGRDSWRFPNSSSKRSTKSRKCGTSGCVKARKSRRLRSEIGSIPIRAADVDIASGSRPRRASVGVRIGANWGSLDQELLTHLMDETAVTPKPLEARVVMREAMVQSALLSAARAEEMGLARERIVLSAKVSAVQDLIAVYRTLAARSNYALHLGLTEAGMGSKGIVASSAALGILLQEGIGDTIRVSLTPEPNGDRSLEVKVAQEILQTMGFRTFTPQVAACPGCGRTTSTVFQELASEIQGYLADAMPVWRKTCPGVETLDVAVMGCIVNGPGESKHADIGISLPGAGETPAAPVFIDGAKALVLRGPTIAADFKALVADSIDKRFGSGTAIP